MKARSIFVILIIFSFLLSPNSIYASTGEIYPCNLQCEYLGNPSVIDILSPRLSWINKTVRDDIQGQRQTAWQIRVASSPDKLSAGNPDLWDSGKTKNDSSLFIKYDGKPLQSCQQCWWQVRVWDANKNISEWSEPAYWGMGLLTETDWQANWIGVPWQGEEAVPVTRLEEAPPVPLLRKEFTTLNNKHIKSARVYTTGLGYFEIYINGEKVGRDILAPAQTNYDKRPGLINRSIPVEDNFTEYKVMYLCYDLTTQLRKGQNAIGAVLGNGFYHSDSGWTMAYGSPRFIAQLHIEYTDGTEQVIVSDTSWMVSRSAILHNGLYSGEMYDANREQSGWNTAGFNDSGWQPAVIRRTPYGKLKAQMTPTDKVMERLKPVSITKTGEKSYKIDFGEEISGRVSLLDIQSQRGDTLSVKYVSESPNGKHIYICRGGGESHTPRFTWYVFREVEINGWNGELTPEQVIAEAVYTDVGTIGKFECSNPLFNQINRIWWRSMTDNIHGSIMSDCPHRERSAYTGDGQTVCVTAMHNLDMKSFYTKWIEDIRGAQNPVTGYVPNGAPWQPGCGGGVAWGAAINIMPWEFYLHYGDMDMLARNFEAMKKQVGYLTNWRLPDGTIESKAPMGSEKPHEWMNLGEWCPPDVMLPNALVHTFYFWYCADLTARTARVLSQKEDANVYSKMADDIRNAFISRFYDAEAKSFGKYGANIFALYMMKGLDTEMKTNVIQSLHKDIVQAGGNLDTGVFGTQFFFEVLAENGLNELAFEAMNKRTYPSYGHWIEQGATTTWEEWGGRNSRNHPMFGNGLTWFYRCLAGMKADEHMPGYKHIILKPQPVEKIDWASYHHGTLYGDAGIKWNKNNGKLSMEITIPVGTTATVYMPVTQDTAKDALRKNCNKWVELEQIKNNYAIYKVTGSGKFFFTE